MTLVELLLVISLVAFVTLTVGSRWSQRNEASALRTARATLVDLDARARLFARGGTPVVLVVSHGGRDAELREHATARLLRSVDLAEPLRLSLTPAAIVFDRAGRSIDYVCDLALEHRSERWSVCGSSGWVRQAEDGT